jgi:hypothetical protein
MARTFSRAETRSPFVPPESGPRRAPPSARPRAGRDALTLRPARERAETRSPFVPPESGPRRAPPSARPRAGRDAHAHEPEPPPRSQPEALTRAPFSGTPPASSRGCRGNGLTYRAVLLGAHTRSFTQARKKLKAPGSLQRWIGKRFARSPSNHGVLEVSSHSHGGASEGVAALWAASEVLR